MRFYRTIFLKYLKLVNSFGSVGEKSIYITTKKLNINKYFFTQPTNNQFYLSFYQIKKILPSLVGKAQNGNSVCLIFVKQLGSIMENIMGSIRNMKEMEIAPPHELFARRIKSILLKKNYWLHISTKFKHYTLFRQALLLCKSQ